MREHNHVFDRETMILADMPHERVDVPDQRSKTRGTAALAVGMPMAPRIPGEDRDVPEPEFFDDVIPSAGMLVAAVKKQQGLLAIRARNPGAVKEPGPVPAPRRVLRDLHFVSPVLARRIAIQPRWPRWRIDRGQHSRN